MRFWHNIHAHTETAQVGFTQNLNRCDRIQKNYLLRILARNSRTEFGRQHKFDCIGDINQFQTQIPVHQYDDLAEMIEDSLKGKRQTLFAGNIVAFEETGGSSGKRKLVPYTADGLADFQAALFPWLGNLISTRPAMTQGCAYWAISPVTRTKKTVEDGTTLGLSDADYFGELAPDFVALSAVSPGLADLTELDDWRRQTLLQLLAREDLSLISVWSPTFLLVLLEHIRELVPSLLSGLTHDRKHIVQRALETDPLNTSVLWPKLDTISCWTHGCSAAFIQQIRLMFPKVNIQGKGLLLTEGAVSIPQSEFDWPVLAANSGFFEFLDASGKCYFAHELTNNQVYRLLMTNNNGLYRYDTNDMVRVRGWAGNTPQLEFIGRDGLVSDICGEKLTDGFVATCLMDTNGFAMLAPSITCKPHYILFIDANNSDNTDGSAIARRVDQKLCANPQYKYARELGQLSGLRTCFVHRPLEKYACQGMEAGQRLGDIKPVALRPETDWEVRFS